MSQAILTKYLHALGTTAALQRIAGCISRRPCSECPKFACNTPDNPGEFGLTLRELAARDSVSLICLRSQAGNKRTRATIAVPGFLPAAAVKRLVSESRISSHATLAQSGSTTSNGVHSRGNSVCRGSTPIIPQRHHRRKAGRYGGAALSSAPRWHGLDDTATKVALNVVIRRFLHRSVNYNVAREPNLSAAESS